AFAVFSHFRSGQTLPIRDGNILGPLVGLGLWTAVIRPWSIDWKNGLSDIRDWAVPIAAYWALTIIAQGKWRKCVYAVVFIAVVQACFGILQHLVDDMRPFIEEGVAKQGYGITPGDEIYRVVSFSVGLFAHP